MGGRNEGRRGELEGTRKRRRTNSCMYPVEAGAAAVAKEVGPVAGEVVAAVAMAAAVEVPRLLEQVIAVAMAAETAVGQEEGKNGHLCLQV